SCPSVRSFHQILPRSGAVLRSMGLEDVLCRRYNQQELSWNDLPLVRPGIGVALSGCIAQPSEAPDQTVGRAWGHPGDGDMAILDGQLDDLLSLFSGGECPASGNPHSRGGATPSSRAFPGS